MNDTSDHVISQPLYFSDAVLRQLKQVKESSRRGRTHVNWARVRSQLEAAAVARESGLACLANGDLRLTDVRGKYTDGLKAADTLLRLLGDERFSSLDVSSNHGARVMVGYPTWPSLAKQLRGYRDELKTRIEWLEGLRGQEPRWTSMTRKDCDQLFRHLIFDIAHELFGPEVGGENGPVVKFARIAVRQVLGKSTPSPEAMRKEARVRQR